MTMALPGDLTLKDLHDFVRDNDRANKYKKSRDALADKLKKAFVGFLPFGKPVVYGDVQVKLAEQKRFNAAAFAKAHPVEKFPELYTMQLDVEAIPATMKTPRFFTPAVVLTASMVEVAEVVLSDSTTEEGAA